LGLFGRKHAYFTDARRAGESGDLLGMSAHIPDRLIGYTSLLGPTASNFVDEAQRRYDSRSILGEFAPNQSGMVFEELLAGLDEMKSRRSDDRRYIRAQRPRLRFGFPPRCLDQPRSANAINALRRATD
jgi:hypothetical protein